MKTGILVAAKPGDGLSHVVLDGKSMSMGRDAQCDIVVSHASVSRRHGRLQRQGPFWVVVDEHSRNGTTVNGVAVVTQRLRDQDRVQFGDVAFTFVEGEPPAQAAPPPAAARTGMSREETMPQVRAAVGATDADTAWRAIRYAAFQPGLTPTVWTEEIVHGVAGLAGVLHVLAFLPRGTLDDGETFLRSAGLEGRPYFEETLREVAQGGVALCSAGGRRAPYRPAGAGMEAVYAPIQLPGRSGGCLYVEADDVFPRGVPEILIGQAEALAIGLRLLAGPSLAASPAIEVASVPPEGIVGRSAALQDAIRTSRKVAASDLPVLVTGETGTGKELLSKLVWSESRRADGPFLPVQLGSIPPKLVADALFGHEKGAFSDAVAARKGYFEEADGGTIFLDEIGDIPLDVQISMLRLLQEKEVIRLGSNKPKKVDVRIIAATNRDLAQAVRDGSFREDLYYRLKVVEIVSPPLRARKEDIPDLVRAFIDLTRHASPSRIERVDEAALRRLTAYGWPGNIRELRNVIERAMVLGDGDTLRLEDLPPDVRDAGSAPTASAGAAAGPAAGPAADGPLSLEEVERRHIRATVDRCRGNLAEAARQLGISRSTLYTKLESGKNPPAAAG